MRGCVATCFMVLLFLNVIGVIGIDLAGGEDSKNGPRAVMMIYDVYDLQDMNLVLNGSYELANDIDATGTAAWNSGAGFAPIGDSVNAFKGSLDGKNFTIRGLSVNRSKSDYVG